MQVVLDAKYHVHRGGPVEVGNVYANQHHLNFRVVLNVMSKTGDRPWNNVVCICINPAGEIVGAKCEPEGYLREHQDLVGKVKEMPSLKIEWLQP